MTRWLVLTILTFCLGMTGVASAGTILAVELRQGAYVNEDANTRSTTRMTFHYTTDTAPRCTDRADGTTVCHHGVWQDFRIRLWGSCTPQDCDWGTVQAERRVAGSNSVYVARYDQGFAERTVEIHPLGNSRLRLVVRSTFSDGRAARTDTSIMAMEAVSREPRTDRPGADYRNFDLTEARPELCAAECEADYACRAYTFVRPNLQGPQARCWLKSSVPPPQSSTCCESGRK